MAEKMIAKVSDVPVGSSKTFSHNGVDGILVNIEGGFHACSSTCTHLGCTVIFKDGLLRCPCHGSQYDPKTGAVVKGPAKKQLKNIVVEVKDGKIFAED